MSAGLQCRAAEDFAIVGEHPIRDAGLDLLDEVVEAPFGGVVLGGGWQDG
jgi:hypothetical protein